MGLRRWIACMLAQMHARARGTLMGKAAYEAEQEAATLAIHLDHVAELEALMQRGLDLWRGEAFVHAAITHGSNKCLRALLQRAPPPHSAFMCAVRNLRVQAIRILLAAGAQPPPWVARDALRYCDGARNIHQRMRSLLTLLWRANASMRGALQPAVLNHPALVPHLLRMPCVRASINEVCEDTGESALTAACGRTQYAGVRLLLEAGADVHVRSSDGSTALMDCVQSMNDDTIRVAGLLLRAGVDVNAANEWGWNALTTCLARNTRAATMHYVMHVVRRLLAAGADPNLGDAMAFAAGANTRALPLVRMLVKAGGRVTDAVLVRSMAGPWAMAGLPDRGAHGRASDPCMLQYLLSRGASPNNAARCGAFAQCIRMRPLAAAMTMADDRSVAQLLAAGANLNFSTDGARALCFAFLQGNFAAARTLLCDGVFTDEVGETTHLHKQVHESMWLVQDDWQRWSAFAREARVRARS